MVTTVCNVNVSSWPEQCKPGEQKHVLVNSGTATPRTFPGTVTSADLHGTRA